MTKTETKRRWFRFSLRTLFGLVTIVGVGAGWVVYQLDWIRERHTLLASRDNWSWTTGGTERPAAPWSLRLFGEKGYAQIMVVIVDPTRALGPAKESDSVESDSYRLTPIERRHVEQVGRIFPEAHTFALFRKVPIPSDQQRY
jgi:hypothetical protein